MSIGERVKFFRNLRGMSQKEFGILAEFPPRSADIRIAQYESGTRTPRGNILERLAYYLKVTPVALEVPSFESDYHFMHTLFMLEDKYGFEIERVSPREITLKLKTSLPPLHPRLSLNPLLSLPSVPGRESFRSISAELCRLTRTRTVMTCWIFSNLSAANAS